MIHVTQSALGQIIDIFNKRKKAIGLSKYSVGDILDHGGMSNIYVVSDGSGNTDYVLRVSEEHKSPYSHDIFNVRELKILQELQKNRQPHVVQYLDAFAVDVAGYPRYYCAVMKFLNTLKQYRVKGDGVEIAVRLGSDFLPLLQSFMDKKILHRDIKPENIYYDGDFRNETGFLLGDFGIAKHDTNTSVTPTGTETTMAPEVRGLDRSLGRDRTYSDMYSLGIVMYRYLNQGVYPSNRERIDKIPPDTNPFPEPRYGSKRLKALVLKATSYNPNDRFESPQAMLRELQQCWEYGEFILEEPNELQPNNEAELNVIAEIERLRSELNEQEQQRQEEIERLKQQTVQRERELMEHLSQMKTQKKRGNVKSASPQNSSLPASQKMQSNHQLQSHPRKNLMLGIVVVSVIAIFVIITAVINSVSRKDDSDIVITPSDVGNDYEISSYVQAEVVPLEECKKIKEGLHISFGSYKQGANGEVQPIEWRVLKVQGSKALVISERLLDYLPYHDSEDNVTWETCSLRKWLNKDFLNEAFTAAEQKKIVTVKNSNPKNPEYAIKGGKDTQDKIFLLTIEDAKEYFSSDEERMAYTTDYAHKNGYDGDYRVDYWWLRSPGDSRSSAAGVRDLGIVLYHGQRVNSSGVAIRPVLWLNTK